MPLSCKLHKRCVHEATVSSTDGGCWVEKLTHNVIAERASKVRWIRPQHPRVAHASAACLLCGIVCQFEFVQVAKEPLVPFLVVVVEGAFCVLTWIAQGACSRGAQSVREEKLLSLFCQGSWEIWRDFLSVE